MSTHYLEQERDNTNKAFSFKHASLGGKSTQDEYKQQGSWVDANTLYRNCLMYATAYTETMLTRAKAEDPEIFATKGMSKSEMQALMTNNMCVPYKKVQVRAFRDATAKITEKKYLNDDIRRLANQGDKFHPYF